MGSFAAKRPPVWSGDRGVRWIGEGGGVAFPGFAWALDVLCLNLLFVCASVVSARCLSSTIRNASVRLFSSNCLRASASIVLIGAVFFLFGVALANFGDEELKRSKNAFCMSEFRAKITFMLGSLCAVASRKISSQRVCAVVINADAASCALSNESSRKAAKKNRAEYHLQGCRL